MPKRKTEEVGSLSKSEKVSLNRLYSRGRAAYGSLRNLSKASGLSKKKVEQFLQTKTSYTKFGPPIRRFRRLQAFSKYINEIWCMDLTFVDKLASQNKGVKYLLVAVDVLLRFVRVQTMKTEYAKDTLQAFKKMISHKNTPEKLWVDKGTEYGGTFKKFCKEKSIEVYSTMSETKAAFAERAIQLLKHIIYRYIEDHGEKFINKLPQFVSTLNCRINRSIGKSHRDAKNTDFFSILYNKPLTRYKKLKFKVGDRVRISKKDIPFRKGYKPQFTDETFEVLVISTKKPPTYIIKDLDKEEILGKFYEKELRKCSD